MDSHTQRGLGKSSSSSEDSASRMTDPAFAPKPKTDDGGGWKVQSVTVEPADNGGFIVRCSKNRDAKPSTGNGPSPMNDTYKSTQNAFSNLNDALAYVSDELGGGGAASAPADEGAADAGTEQGDEMSGGGY